ncbi:OmpA family protein [Prosthecobacter fusiformis]|uniref:OmpA family protein n=1 Tax=Prosthecobacter fusiformis TaxID=48464 RepID=A0A4R7RR08_9BACT|nr:OmpA family protein [Prosthecobacter fusiformis]TDU67308.1 OmpA family protein [Prosthecobacter fusiformis]
MKHVLLLSFTLSLLLASFVNASDQAVISAEQLAKKWKRTKSLATPVEETRTTTVKVTKGLTVEVQKVEVKVDADTQERFQNVRFELGSDQIQDGRSFRQLAEIAKAMQMAGTETFLIEGHTCDLGPDADNKDLSQRRAEVVVAELIRLGVPAYRLQFLGFGEERPVTANLDESERSVNRRVEIYRKL